jgi:hypothetical protein
MVMTHKLSNEHNKAVRDPHTALELIVSPCSLEVRFSLEKAG